MKNTLEEVERKDQKLFVAMIGCVLLVVLPFSGCSCVCVRLLVGLCKAVVLLVVSPFSDCSRRVCLCVCRHVGLCKAAVTIVMCGYDAQMLLRGCVAGIQV